jgi:hemerythrin-like domain-containing protein
VTDELDRPAGWPPALRFLLERHPREAWAGHAALGALGRYWLERHASFRELAGALDAATADFQAGRMAPAEFQRWFAPRLQFFLSHLGGHHEVEDYYYFPRLRAAEPRLAAGFDVLAADHETIHGAIVETVEAANALLTAAPGADAERLVGDLYAVASARLFALLLRHLDDEEDLIIPLLLERGEGALGVG